MVLSVSTASVFTLPEFAPVSGIGSLRDINDICRDFDDRSLTEIGSGNISKLQDKGVLVTVFTKASIRFVRILPHALKAERKIDYPSALLGFQRSNLALVANAQTYDLVDLQNNQKIPLFEISTGGADEEVPGEEPPSDKAENDKVTPTTETQDDQSKDKSADSSNEATTDDTGESKDIKDKDDVSSPSLTSTTQETSDKLQSKPKTQPEKPQKLAPMACAVSSEEFLVTSGTRNDEPAMGLVVNADGDISRGTIAWPKYPSSIAVDYPYVASVIDNQILFYSLHDQVLVQTLEYPSQPTVYTVTSPISQSYLPLSDKIKLVPLRAAHSAADILGTPGKSESEALENTDNSLSLNLEELTDDEKKRVEKERTYAESLSVISSSLFVYCFEKGVECLLSSPRIFHLEKLVEQNRMDEVRDEMGTIEVSTERTFVEIEYLGLLVGFGYLLNEDFEEATNFWLEGTLDPRMVIYVFDRASVKGDLWTFNGLITFIKKTFEKLSDLKTSSKLTTTETITEPPPPPVTPKKSKKGKKKGSKSTSSKDSSSNKTSTLTQTPDKLKDALQYYEYFLSEWLKRRELESVNDKPNVFYSLEVAYLHHLLYTLGQESKIPDTLSEIPTTREKLYAFLRTEVIESSENALTVLGEHGEYYCQFMLYQKLGREQDACLLWKQILEGDIQDSNFTQNEQDFAEYLQHESQNKELIWDYGMWLVERVPEIGLPIFAYRDHSQDATKPAMFDDTQVLNALKGLKNHEPWRKFLKILVYERHEVSLQSQLIELTVDDVLLKLDVRNGSTKAAKLRKGIMEINNEYKNLSFPKREYVEFLLSKIDRLKQQSLAKKQKEPLTAGDELEDLIEVNQMRVDLLKLLLFDGNYDVQAINQKLEYTDVVEILPIETCIIYSRLRLHEQCLNVLMGSLLSLDQALEYCLYGKLTIKSLMKKGHSDDTEVSPQKVNKKNQHNDKKKGHQSKSSSSSIQTADPGDSNFLESMAYPPLADHETQRQLFVLLFDIILSLPDDISSSSNESSTSIRTFYTCKLLEQYGHYLDTITVLSKIPGDWPLENIDAWLRGALRNVLSQKVESTMEKSLARSENGYIGKMHREWKKAEKKALRGELT